MNAGDKEEPYRVFQNEESTYGSSFFVFYENNRKD